MRQHVRLLSVLLALFVSKGASAQGTLWQTYHDAGTKALGENKIEEAERLVRAAMAEAAVFGVNDPYRRQAKSYGILAWILHRQGRDDTARPLAEWALTIDKMYEQQPGIATAYNLNTLGAIFQTRRDYVVAEDYFRQAFALYEARRNLEPGNYIVGLDNLALVLENRKKYEEAAALRKRSVVETEAAKGALSLETAEALTSTANTLMYQEKMAEAESLFDQALAIRATKAGRDSAATASSLIDLGDLSERRGWFQQAEKLFQRALTIREGLDPPDKIAVAWLLDRIGEMYYRAQKYDDASTYYQRGIKLRERAQGAAHPDVAANLMDIAWLNLRKPDYAAAERAAKKALAIRTRMAGEEAKADVAWSVEFLGLLASARKDYPAAINFHKRRAGHPREGARRWTPRRHAQLEEHRPGLRGPQAIRRGRGRLQRLRRPQGAGPRPRPPRGRASAPRSRALLHRARTQRSCRKSPHTLNRD